MTHSLQIQTERKSNCIPLEANSSRNRRNCGFCSATCTSCTYSTTSRKARDDSFHFPTNSASDVHVLTDHSGASESMQIPRRCNAETALTKTFSIGHQPLKWPQPMRKLSSSSSGQAFTISLTSSIHMLFPPSSNCTTRTCLPNVPHSASNALARPRQPSMTMFRSEGISQNDVCRSRNGHPHASARKRRVRSAQRVMRSWQTAALGIRPVRTSSESDGVALSMSVREFIPPVSAAAPVLSKVHSSRWSAGKAGAAVGNSEWGEEGRE